MHRPLLALLLLACGSDYDLLNEKADERPGRDTDATDEDDTGPFADIDACGDPPQPAPSAVPLNDECEVELSTGSFTPVVEWSYGSSAFCGPAGVGQIVDTNSDGLIDSEDIPMVLIYQNQRVIALNGRTGTPQWSTTAMYGQDGGFAIGDVDNDGQPDVVTASESKVCALSGSNGAEKWCKTGLNSSLDPYGYSYPSLADMDGDGNVEVVVGDAIIRGADGTLLARGGRGKGAAPYGGSGVGGTYGALSAVIDLDGDGSLEVVTGSTAYNKDGSVKWDNGGLDGLVAVADFDGDGQGEIVKTSGIYVYGMESDGTVAWGPLTYSGNLSAPGIDDLDGDGQPEIVFAAQNSLVALNWGGSVKWNAAITDASGAAGPTFFDFEMDGYPEVLFADETTVRFFSGLDGSEKFRSTAHGSYTILETPVVADIDGDDQVEIIVGHCVYSGSYGGVTVYGDADQTWPPGRKIWNQHAYYITNIEDNGTVPSPTEANYSLYNSFRSGDVGRPPSEYWDLTAEILDVCEDDCDEGKVYIAARIANNGNIEAPSGLPVSLRANAGGPIVASLLTPAAIPSGTTGEMVLFEVASADLAGSTPVVVADENSAGVGSIYECSEVNNAAAWSETVCD
jgi:hypothetical protein